jgi:hypothetical protein
VVPRKYLSRVHVNQEGLKTNKPNFGVKKKSTDIQLYNKIQYIF